MTKSEATKIAAALKKQLIEDESFLVELAKEMLTVKVSDLGLQGPGSLYDFFRNEWQVEAGKNI